MDDLEDILEEEKDVLPPESWEKLTALHEEFSEIVNDLHGNLKKIEEHGNRATSIIRGILLYSRGKDDEYIPTDIKNLVKEYVWLAYHSMRANYKGFNIAIGSITRRASDAESDPAGFEPCGIECHE